MHSLLQLQVCLAPWEVPRLFPAPEAKWFTYCRRRAWEPWSCLRPREGFQVVCAAVRARDQMENAIGSWHCTGLPQPWDNDWDGVIPVTQELEVQKPRAAVGLQGGQCWYSEKREEKVSVEEKNGWYISQSPLVIYLLKMNYFKQTHA